MGEQPIVLDVGGAGTRRPIGMIADGVQHPEWRHARFLTINIASSCSPDILDDAVRLKGVRDGCADGIYSAHMVEHIPPSQTAGMFRSWYRVLKPGGRLEIRCPDVEWAWREFLAGRLPSVILDEVITGISDGPYQVHQNAYWHEKLTQALKDAGFADASRVSYGNTTPLLDFWFYDGKDGQSHGRPILDLVVAAYKPPLGTAPVHVDSGLATAVTEGSYEQALASVLIGSERWRRAVGHMAHAVRRTLRVRSRLRPLLALPTGLIAARIGHG